MSKTNKELAVDFAMAYVGAQSNLFHPGDAGSVGIAKAEEYVKVIGLVYTALESLDDESK